MNDLQLSRVLHHVAVAADFAEIGYKLAHRADPCDRLTDDLAELMASAAEIKLQVECRLHALEKIHG